MYTTQRKSGPRRRAPDWDRYEAEARGGPRPRRDGYDEPGSERQPKRRRRKKRGGAGVKALCVVLVLLAAVFAAYRVWARPPELPGQAETGRWLTGERKKDFYTFLLIGRDTGGGGNTDVIMLGAYDIPNQRAALMSIPRDTMVNVSWDVKKINTVYNRNLSGGSEAAAQALAEQAAGLVGFLPDYTVTLEWEAVGEIVDAIGGVTFDVPFYMHYVDPTQDLYIDQQPGTRLLTGADAMQVVRWRKNNGGVPNPAGTDGSDLGRTQVQQDFIAAAVRQCLQLRNVARLGEIAGVFTQRVETGLSVGNMVWFGEKALLGGFSTDELYTCTMPNSYANVYSSTYNAKLSYVVPRGEELLQTVNQYFNPYLTDVTMDNVELMQVNGDGSVTVR